MIVSLTDEAKADAQEAADWYIDQDAWPAALALQQEITRALARLVRSPGLGTPGDDGTRVLPIHVFPISLVYRVADQHIQVIAVAAQRRRPNYWLGRR